MPTAPTHQVLTHQGLARGLFAPTLAAGRLQLAMRHAGLVAEQKADASPVTEADRASEQLLTEALAELAPGVPVVAEEAVAAGHVPDFGDTLFLMDPLDGTREYIRGGDDFTVNVALVVHGRPIFGIIYAPARRWMCLTLEQDRAAEAQIAADETVAFDDVAWTRMTARVADPGKLMAVASRSHKSPAEDAFLDSLGVIGRTSIGSSLKFCLLARGDADVYPRFGPISEWDTAAGHALLVAAGGAVATRSGEDWLYGDRAGGFRAKPFIAWGRRA